MKHLPKSTLTEILNDLDDRFAGYARQTDASY